MYQAGLSPPLTHMEARSRGGAPCRCARSRHTPLLTRSRTRERGPRGTSSTHRRNHHARTPPHRSAHHIFLHNITQQRTAAFQDNNSRRRTPTTHCTQAHDSSRTHARLPGRRQPHRSSSSSSHHSRACSMVQCKHPSSIESQPHSSAACSAHLAAQSMPAAMHATPRTTYTMPAIAATSAEQQHNSMQTARHTHMHRAASAHARTHAHASHLLRHAHNTL